MKLIHISDLHIGKRVYEFPMLEDQKYILAQILAVTEREKADGIMIAGDIYDKPVPPAEAVQVFDDFLTKLAALRITVFVVSGNHDSAERLAFGARLMSGRGVYFSPVYDGCVQKVCMQDTWGEVWIYLLPFIKPAVVRHAMEKRDSDDGEEIQDLKIETYQDALMAAVQGMQIDPSKRNILVAHQFVTGAARCESEEVQVGGLDQIEVSVFDKFDYVALGHLHSPQSVGRETVRYCGTPLKYSFSEAGQEKSVTVVELGAKGEIVIRTIPLIPLRDMKKIRGSYQEVMFREFYQNMNTEDYIQMTLTDEEDIPDGLQRLRTVYPNLMHLEYDNKRTRSVRSIEGAEEAEKKTELELFEEFYELQNNQEMSGQQRTFARQMIRELLEKERDGRIFE